MNVSTTLEKTIMTIFSSQMGVDVPSADTDLMEAGFLDSMSLVNLLTHLESDFGFRIRADDLELDDFRSVERIARFVAAQKKASARAAGDFELARPSVA